MRESNKQNRVFKITEENVFPLTFAFIMKNVGPNESPKITVNKPND